MTDDLARLRAEALEELAELQGTSEPASDDREADDLLLIAHQPESAAFIAALEFLAQNSRWADAPSGRAAATAKSLGPATPTTVLGGLAAPAAKVRAAIERGLYLGRDAAELLLDRPAAALMTYDPVSVRQVAKLVDRNPGELFAAVAASARSSGQYVYAYRPGGAADGPAQRPSETLSSDPLLTWGLRLMDEEVDRDQSRSL
jgi:hypothetical protein